MKKKNMKNPFKKNKVTLVPPTENKLNAEPIGNKELEKVIVPIVDERIDSIVDETIGNTDVIIETEIESTEEKTYLIIFSDKSEGYTSNKDFQKEGLTVLCVSEVTETLPFIPFL